MDGSWTKKVNSTYSISPASRRRLAWSSSSPSSLSVHSSSSPPSALLPPALPFPANCPSLCFSCLPWHQEVNLWGFYCPPCSLTATRWRSSPPDRPSCLLPAWLGAVGSVSSSKVDCWGQLVPPTPSQACAHSRKWPRKISSTHSQYSGRYCFNNFFCSWISLDLLGVECTTDAKKTNNNNKKTHWISFC